MAYLLDHVLLTATLSAARPIGQPNVLVDARFV
jgi:hypothetical protein